MIKNMKDFLKDSLVSSVVKDNIDFFAIVLIFSVGSLILVWLVANNIPYPVDYFKTFVGIFMFWLILTGFADI